MSDVIGQNNPTVDVPAVMRNLVPAVMRNLA
jgi:hypothetical protein